MKNGRLRITRNRRQAIIVRCGNEELRIEVYEIRASQIALVFEGPRSFEIWREEIDQRLKQQGLVARFQGEP